MCISRAAGLQLNSKSKQSSLSHLSTPGEYLRVRFLFCLLFGAWHVFALPVKKKNKLDPLGVDRLRHKGPPIPPTGARSSHWKTQNHHKPCSHVVYLHLVSLYVILFHVSLQWFCIVFHCIVSLLFCICLWSLCRVVYFASFCTSLGTFCVSLWWFCLSFRDILQVTRTEAIWPLAFWVDPFMPRGLDWSLSN